MLVRLLYASRPAQTIDNATIDAILEKSRLNNPARGITGLLCFGDDLFMQVLEGGRSPVSGLYNRIACDPRHHDVVLLSYEEIGERSFAGWSMGQVNLSRLNPALLLKYSERPELDPYSVSGRVSLAFFNELVATAAVMGQC